MYYDALAQGVKHFKETEKGRDQMCEAVENYAKEYAKRHAEEYAKEYAKEYEIKGKIAIVQNVMEKITAHALRDTFATRYIEQGEHHRC